ncbi:MAG: TRAP transporter small permease subunit [Deltaproteobacteria bacterium]|nr:MAG: TRAP transporter small permease subunit [Deltaproteobacteria bacterium]
MECSPENVQETPAGGLHNAPRALAKTIRIIDGLSIVSGKIVGWFIFPMVFSLVFEVVARYLFNAPTIWAGDVSQILYGMFFMLGSAYALQRQQHIRTDFIYGKWSIRTRGMVDAALYILFYFPALGFFLWVGSDFAYRSILFNEKIVTSAWMPIIWPLKLAIPVSTLLLLIQGVSELLKSLFAARTNVSLFEETAGSET